MALAESVDSNFKLEEAIVQVVEEAPDRQIDAVELLVKIHNKGYQDMDAREALWNMMYLHRLIIDNNWKVGLPNNTAE